MYAIWFKAGCETHQIAPSGVRILAALDTVARTVLLHDLIITCGTDSHGPDDPHSKGMAFDVRSHDLTPTQKTQCLAAVMHELSEGMSDPVLPKDGGFVTHKFFGWLEHPSADNEHYHFQLRNGMVYP